MHGSFPAIEKDPQGNSVNEHLFKTMMGIWNMYILLQIVCLPPGGIAEENTLQTTT